MLSKGHDSFAEAVCHEQRLGFCGYSAGYPGSFLGNTSQVARRTLKVAYGNVVTKELRAGETTDDCRPMVARGATGRAQGLLHQTGQWWRCQETAGEGLREMAILPFFRCPSKHASVV